MSTSWWLFGNLKVELWKLLQSVSKSCSHGAGLRVLRYCQRLR